MGFSEKEILEFARSTLVGSFTEFRHYLTTNPVVKEMMYNPLNCEIIVGRNLGGQWVTVCQLGASGGKFGGGGAHF